MAADAHDLGALALDLPRPTPELGQPEQRRLRDAVGYRLRVACICFQFADGPLPRLLLISSTSKTGRWIVPAGGMEEGETAGAAASREAHEEAGVTGTVAPLCWVHDHDKKYRTALFALHVSSVLHDGYADAGRRERRWFDLHTAMGELGRLPVQAAVIAAGLHALAGPAGIGLPVLPCHPAVLPAAIASLSMLGQGQGQGENDAAGDPAPAMLPHARPALRQECTCGFGFGQSCTQQQRQPQAAKPKPCVTDVDFAAVSHAHYEVCNSQSAPSQVCDISGHSSEAAGGAEPSLLFTVARCQCDTVPPPPPTTDTMTTSR